MKPLHLVAGLALISVVLACSGLGPAEGGGSGGAGARYGSSPPVTLTLHGNTPSLAWNPSGTKLLASAAYEHESHGDRIGDTSQLGLHLVEIASGQASREIAGGAFHPVWLDDSAFAWSLGSWEARDGQEPGLYWFDGAKHRANDPESEGPSRDLSALRALEGGRLLVWADYSHAAPGWWVFEPRGERWERWEGEAEEPPEDSWGSGAWYPPVPDPQCLDRAGGARIEITGEAFEVERNGEVVARGQLYPYRYAGGGEGPCSDPAMCGPVAPCLSPRGTHVAWAAPGDAASWTLQIRALP